MNLHPSNTQPMTAPPALTPSNDTAAQRQATMDAIARQHSMFWIGANADELIEKLHIGSSEYIERLRHIQQAIGNFVHITTNKDISVVFSGGVQSYTNGKTVVLSADTDPTKLDVLVGTALHEGAHCHLSNQALDFLPEMFDQFDHMITPTKLPALAAKLKMQLMPATRATPSVPENPPAKSSKSSKSSKPTTASSERPDASVYELVQMVMNVLEDRRIDLWMYTEAAGYRPYYEAMYNCYWHNPKIDQALQSPYYRSLSVDNYAMHVINMTNEHYDIHAMPALDEIKKLAKLYPAGLASRGDEDPNWKTWRRYGAQSEQPIEKMPILFRDAVAIVELMLEHSTSVRNLTPPPPQPKDTGNQDNGDLPNLDGGIPSQEDIDAIMDTLKKFLRGELDKTALDAQSQAILEQMDATRAQIKDVTGDFIAKDVKARVIIYRNITKAVAKSSLFPMSIAHNYDASGRGGSIVTRGVQMGQVLANRIRVVQDERPITFTRQQSGRLDKRLIADLGYGSVQVFSHMMMERKKPVDVWIDIDVSGSMAGKKFENAMTVAVAIAYAASKTRTLNCTVAIRAGNHQVANIAILYDSRTQRLQQFLDVIPFIGSSGGTPEGLCFEAVKDEILKKSRDSRKFFINLSDGEPAHSFMYKGRGYQYGGAAAVEHTRNMMREMRAAGIDVLSYYVDDGAYTGREHPNFKRMYGDDAVFVDPQQVLNIVQTINNMIINV